MDMKVARGSFQVIFLFQVLLQIILAAPSHRYYDGHHSNRAGHYHGYGGLQPVHNGVAAPYRNDLRQHAVNSVAEYHGTGTGTAKYYGVPGSASAKYPYGYGRGYGRKYRHHGDQYGHGGYHAHGRRGYHGDGYGYDHDNYAYGYDNDNYRYDNHRHGPHYNYGGLQETYGGVAAPYRNDLRQHAVNAVAEYHGTGTGTGKYYGVPGSAKSHRNRHY